MAILGVDVGGTFTDAVLLQDGEVRTAKVPTAAHQADSVLAAAAAVGAEPGVVERFRHGTTVATNALLERRGARTAFVATQGFEHLLHLRRQNRAHLYRLCAEHPAPLVPLERCVGVRERMGPDGVLRPLDLSTLPDLGDVEAIAVCLLHAYRHPEHERAVAAELRRRHPRAHVVASHEAAPEFREYERASTTAVDAYLGLALGGYLRELTTACSAAGLPEPLVMRSSGGVVTAAEAVAHAAWALLSGPAAGAVGAALVARLAGVENAISFDMGGTSTDVCAVVAGEVQRERERVVGGFPVRLPTVAVHTVGAGGGSIVRRDAGGAIRVGPDSAKADPGPACYGRGGTQPTVTDADLLLGRLPSQLAGDLALDESAAARALGDLDPAAVVAVVEAEILRALRVVSVEQGLDPRDFSLVAFGGAGPLHACSLAEELGMRRVLVPAAAGVLSALGLVAGGERRDSVRAYVCPLEQAGELPVTGEADLRYEGQSFELTVPLGPDLAERFHDAHAARNGYADRDRPIELVAVGTADVRPGPDDFVARSHKVAPRLGATPGRARRCDVLGARGLAGRERRTRNPGPGASAVIDVELQVLGSQLRAVADEMGAVLIRSAFSPNIKERRDCSTALFDAAGRMVAQAEHIPVHLGAMPEAVAAVAACNPAPGEIWILNDPYAGGTHLPDVTTVGRTPIGFAVTRAHHADIGAPEPGSLPAGSRTLADEGVVIPPTRVDEAVIDALVAQMRNPAERLGDLRAQLAAHRLAEQRLGELCAKRGRARVAAAMDELLAYSERVVRAAIADLPDGRFEAGDVLEHEDGELAIRASVVVAGEEIAIDFAGTAAQHAGNLNCPLAVTRSAAYFVVRCLTDPDLPASGGAFAPVAVTAPAGCLVNASPPAAVAAGNVETSSRIVDVLFAAFGQALPVPAQGQGTMNNVVLGNDRFSYYETVAGGQGACPDADGPSAVHVAMTNTLNTPVEALELAYPLRVERYALRLGSGGPGTHRGGDGVIRELRALEACELSVLAQRRATAPRAAAGGADGAPGRTLVNGEELGASVSRHLGPGDVVRIETPGGGGYGRP